MSNMEKWEKLSRPPIAALKPIVGGRLKGKSDINPQWRIQAMTEVYGPCGVGWKFTTDKKWREDGSDGQVMCFADITLYIRENGEWSEGIPGTGGSMLIAQESSKLHTSDEGYKMAVTDALSTAMKMLGVAAEIYLGNFDGSKYQGLRQPQGQQAQGQQQQSAVTDADKDYMLRVKTALDTLYGSDTAQKQKVIAELTAFTGKDGKQVPGVADYRKLTGKRLEILCHNIEKRVPKTVEQPPPLELCNMCREPMVNGKCYGMNCPSAQPPNTDDITY